MVRSIILSVFVALLSTSALADPIKRIAPLLNSDDSESIANSYIVVFKKDASADVMQNHFAFLNTLMLSANAKRGNGAAARNELQHTYELDSFNGYAGQFESEVLEQIRSAEEVEYVEKDIKVYATATQTGAPWGLARISNKKKLDFSNRDKYNYDADNAGEGVTVYVVDTGVNIGHDDFGGRATWGATIPSGDADIDGNGHGSHCAGTIAGAKYGVAKKANIVAVKVLRSNGAGTMADVVKGVEWVLKAHKDAVKSGKARKGSVANMSLGGGKSPSLNAAVNAAVDGGVTFAVAAGNDNRDACYYSPASADKAITVGATTVDDDRSYFSNYGKCVDVFAPGSNIQSVWIGSKTATNTISGTSMASPHVAGLAAYVLGKLSDGTKTITPKQVKDEIINTATNNAIRNVGSGSPNRFVWNGFQA